jgi:hypothetical protein
MRRLAFVAAAGAAAAVLAAAGAGAAPVAGGPCVPAGVSLPPVPGAPKLPPCGEEQPRSPIRLSVSGSVVAAIAVTSGPWGRCTAARGGGAHTFAWTKLQLVPTTAAPVTVSRSSLDAQPTVRRSVDPHQNQQHEMPPGCGVVKDPTSCSPSKDREMLIVHLNLETNLARVTLRPAASGLLTAQCTAPFTLADNLFDDLSFQHRYADGVLLRALARSQNPAKRTLTIQWADEADDCEKYGGPPVGGITGGDGTVDTCTIKASFTIVVTRVKR